MMHSLFVSGWGVPKSSRYTTLLVCKILNFASEGKKIEKIFFISQIHEPYRSRLFFLKDIYFYNWISDLQLNTFVSCQTVKVE